MAKQRRRWKYEADAFGRKHRKYFLENVFGIDVFDMKTFRALRAKLSREYLKFFQGLDRKYERGEPKEITKEALRAVHKTVGLVDSMVESGTLHKDDVDTLSSNMEFIHGLKDTLLQKAEQNASLSQKIQATEEESGVSPSDLFVTEKTIRKAASREIKKGKEGAIPFLKRTMPRTLGLAGELAGGAAAAALGPLTPIAQMVKGVGTDIFGLGTGITQKVRERREQRLQRTLTSKLSRGEGESRSSLKSSGSLLSRTSAPPSLVAADEKALYNFYNSGAYKAKWTKELLKNLSGDEGRGGVRGLLGGLADKFKSLGAVIGPLIGKAGLIAALGIGAGWSITKFSELKTAVGEYLEAKKAETAAQERALEANKQWLSWVDSRMPDWEKGSKEAEGAIAYAKERRERRAESLQLAPSGVEDPFKSPSSMTRKQIQKESTEILKQIKTEGAESLTVKEQQRFLQLGGMNVPADQKELMEQVRKLSETISRLSENVDKNRRSSGMREPGIGNPWDTSDPGIKSISGAELEMDE